MTGLLNLAASALLTAWAWRVARHDMATGKVPNAELGRGALLVAAWLALAALLAWLAPEAAPRWRRAPDFYSLFFLHLLLSALAGVILWFAEIWPAGDAKYFIVLSAALPLAGNYQGYYPARLTANFLVNIFVAATAWVVFRYLAGRLSGRAEARKATPACPAWRTALEALWSLAALVPLFLAQQALAAWVISGAVRFLGRSEVLFFFVFILWGKLAPLLRSRAYAAGAGLAAAAYLAAGWLYFPGAAGEALRSALASAAGYGLLLFAGRTLLGSLLESRDKRPVTAEELAPGMVLSAASTAAVRRAPELAGLFDDCYRDGLNEKQLAALKAWLPANGGRLEAVEGKAFAVWIFAGALLTALFDGNLVGAILFLWRG